jgi:hypothetical protein
VEAKKVSFFRPSSSRGGTHEQHLLTGGRQTNET